MNWLDLIATIGARSKVESVGEESEAIRRDSAIAESEDDWREGETKVTPLETAGLTVVMHNCMLQLQILARAQINTSNMSFMTTRKKLIMILRDAEKELRTCHSFDQFATEAREKAKNRKQTNVLEDIAARNANQISTLQSKVRNVQRKNQKELDRRQESIANLKDDIQELITKSDIALRYAERWETARQGQCVIRCEYAEEALKNELAEMKRKFDTEQRVHEQLMYFLEHSTEKLEKEIEFWKDNYDSEFERRKTKIHMIQAKRNEEQSKYRELKDLYDEHQKEINEYLAHKEKQRLEEEQNKFLYDMATKIQAWWRGTMVRRGLGPYKRRKKLGKEKKKKKG